MYNGSTDDDGRPKIIFSNVTEKGVISNTTTSIQDLSLFEVLYILGTEHILCVLYIPFPSSKKTVIAITSMDPTVLGLITVRSIPRGHRRWRSKHKTAFMCLHHSYNLQYSSLIDSL